MYYLIYKITNLINGKIYIGKHQTTNINDDYMGSGKYLKRAQKKYGLKNFKKEILFECSSKEEMDNKEKELVNELFVENDNTYNLKIGGEGGWDYVNVEGKNLYDRTKPSTYKLYQEEGRKLARLMNERKKNKEYSIMIGNKISSSLKNTIKQKGFWHCGRKHTKETIIKLKEYKNKFHPQLGSKNSQYGKVWIYNEILKINKSIKREDLDTYLDKGWKKGRKMKF